MKEKLKDLAIVSHDATLQINYDPDTQENIIQRGIRLKKIVRRLDRAQNVSRTVMLREFEV